MKSLSKNSYLLINSIIFLIFLIININANASSKIGVLEVQNQISILDIYGKRTTLNKFIELKNGDYLKSNNYPTLLVLKNKTKICLSSNSSLKVNIVRNIKEKVIINFQLIKGNIFFSIPDNTKNLYNFDFFSYKIKNINSDFVFSKAKKLKLFNYNKNLKLYFKNNAVLNILPYSNNELLKSGLLKQLIQLDDIKVVEKSFLKGCIPKLNSSISENNLKILQYSCTPKNGNLICGNKYK